MSSDEFYCIHAEQVGLRYPDASHVRHVWRGDHRRIESKVVYGDQIDIFVSVLEPEGTIWHFVEPYQPHKKIARRDGLRTN